MLKRPFVEMALAFVFGILYAVSSKWYFILAVVLLFIAIAASFRKKGQGTIRFIRIGFTALFFVIGMLRYQNEVQFRAAYQEKLEDGKTIKVQGMLDEKEYKNDQYLYYLSDCYAVFSQEMIPCNQILIYSDTDTYSIGEILIVEGKIENWNIAVNEGNFDAKTFYESQKIDFKLKETSVLNTFGTPNRVKEKLYLLKQCLKTVYTECLSEADGGVLTTMVLGDKSLLDAEIKTMYQKVGISHILAISGLHISLIGMTLYRCVRKRGLSFGISGVFAGTILFFYGIMTGFGASTKRAVIMFMLLLLANWIGRSYDSLSALGAAAILILWDNPYLLFYAGFLFSFFAVLGVVLIGQRAVRGMKVDEKKKSGKQNDEQQDDEKGSWRNRMKETLYVSFSIQVATLPLTAFFYYEIPVYSVFVNFIILALLESLLLLGIIGGLVGIWMLPAAKVILFPCHLILGLYLKICSFSGGLPNATWIVGKPELWRMVIYYSLLCLILCIFSIRKKKKGLLIVFGILLALFFVPQKTVSEVDVLDVGQGDGCYIQTGEGYRLFIDGGSTDVKNVGTYRILPFLKAKGAGKIDYWIVSHTDQDHISGLLEVIESGYPIRCILFSKEIVIDEAYESLCDLAETYGIEISDLKQGDCLHLGEAKVTCLFPDAGYVTEDKNAKSLVVQYEDAGFSGIFTGDISEAEEKRLINSGMIEEVDFYKAAHHGSKYSNSSEFLSALSPQIAVISCAENNSYGHPGVEAIEHIEASQSALFYTMKSGQIKISIQDKIVVRSYRSLLDVFYFPVVE